LLEINFFFIGRRLRVDFTHTNLLTTFLRILKLLHISCSNLIASRQRYQIWCHCREEKATRGKEKAEIFWVRTWRAREE